MKTEQEVRLTQFSHGAGCGCKIAPGVLSEIIGEKALPQATGLLVGNQTSDDAAVFAISDERAIISTTDFFMPIVDDPFTFGQIASANAISDVYAMGGRPLMAIAILGWPVNEIPINAAARVLDGARNLCEQAGISLAGGHSIDAKEPIFGLAVTGEVQIEHLKKNSTAVEGDELFLTKPLGIGILSTAQKQGKLAPEHINIGPEQMVRLNDFGAVIASLPGVHAITDVTGFGLLGHLIEMCEASKVSALIGFDKVPIIPQAYEYLRQQCIPGGTHRNWESYGSKVEFVGDEQKYLLADPQTSGGLLLAVAPSGVDEFKTLAAAHSYDLEPLGKMRATETKVITVV